MARAGETEAAGGLDHHLHPLGKEGHALDELRVGGGDDVVDVATNDLERQLPQVLGLCAVGKGLRRVDVDDRAAAKRPLPVVARLGLDAVELALRRQRTQRQRGPAEQAAATQAHEHRVELADLLHQLQRRGALAGDDIRMVVGRDQRQAALARQPTADRLAIFGVAVVHHDLGAIAARCRHLGTRRIVRHHDGGRDAQLPRRQGDRLRMVAGREGDHAGAPLRLAELRQRIEGAAELEGTGTLEVLALEEQLGTQQPIGRGRPKHRRVVGMILEPCSGSKHILVSGHQLDHRLRFLHME